MGKDKRNSLTTQNVRMVRCQGDDVAAYEKMEADIVSLARK